jgi:glycosyltransferase involved in cell wall biosynthesis
MQTVFCKKEKGDVTVTRLPLKVTLVGHPFNPIGTGRALRVVFASCRGVGIEAAVRDVWNFQAAEPAQAISIAPFLTPSFGAINVFHLNGNEIEPALKQFGSLPPGYNIVMPFWELSRYPAEWARQVGRFDEVWAASDFIRQCVAAAVKCPVVHMPLPTEIELDVFRGRRQFGIPEDRYAFLCFFDCRSYITRKNPQAVVECFRRLLTARPWARTSLVIKLHGTEAAPAEIKDFLADLHELQGRVIVIDATMPEVQVHNLIRCCDAFVSLHRSEGYGLGLAEAMYLGRPVIGTAYSGNMDFMTPENSIPVGYHLVPVPPDAYPHSDGQHWAEPNLDEATTQMIKLLDDPAAGMALGLRASRSIRINFSYRAAGLRYLRRLDEITKLNAFAVDGSALACALD